MTLDNDLKQLSNYEHFARFIQHISQCREDSIEKLRNAPTETIQQLSGMILAYDDILVLSDWQGLSKRHNAFLN